MRVFLISLFFVGLSAQAQVLSLKSITTSRQTCTPVLTGATNSTLTARCWRVGDSLYIEGRALFSGAGGAGTAVTLTLPSGYVIDTAKLSGGTAVGNDSSTSLGKSWWWDQGIAPKSLDAVYASTTSATFQDHGAGVVLLSSFGAGDSIKFKLEVPIVGWN